MTNQQKARAKKDCVCESYYHSKRTKFRKGNYYSVKSNPIRADKGLSVYFKGLPTCDVGSPFFEENFELI